MAGQKNLFNRINDRRKGSVERIEARLELSNEELYKTAKTFKSAREAGEQVTEQGFNKYRESMNKTLENTKKRITG